MASALTARSAIGAKIVAEVHTHLHTSHAQSAQKCAVVNICTHGKQRSECGGCAVGGICTHGKICYRCGDCGGGSHISAHKRLSHALSAEKRAVVGICTHGIDQLKDISATRTTASQALTRTQCAGTAMDHWVLVAIPIGSHQGGHALRRT